MLDICKLSKKNKVYDFIFKDILSIKTHKILQEVFHIGTIKLDIDDTFFYDYKKKNLITKWGGLEVKEHYQSNHDLQKNLELGKTKKKLENYLNFKIKKEILKIDFLGNFRIKNLWFTIQTKNEGHSVHNHPKSILSGVYYHKIESGTGGEINIFKKKGTIEHKPKKNDLLIFSSDIYHSVKPYHGKSDRIALAWDAIYTF